MYDIINKIIYLEKEIGMSNNNNEGSSILGTLLLLVILGCFFLNTQAQKDNLSFADEFRKTFFYDEWEREQKREKDKAEGEKWLQRVKETEKKIDQANKAAEASRAKQMRVDPCNAKWSQLTQKSMNDMTVRMVCDTNGDNIYVNESGNIMNLLATNESGIGHDIHDNPMYLDPNDYLVFVLEFDINGNRKRIVDSYHYNASTGRKSGTGEFDAKQFGQWESIKPDFYPNYINWLKENYDKFYRLPR